MPTSRSAFYYDNYEDWENDADYGEEDDVDEGEPADEATEVDDQTVERINLLELPAEILDNIFEYVLGFQGCFIATGHFRLWLEGFTQHQAVRNTDQVQAVQVRPVIYPELDTQIFQSGKSFFTPLSSWEARLRDENLPLIIRKELKGTRQFKHSVDTNLLFTCRQTYDHFSELIYTKSVFAFGSFSALNHMLDASRATPLVLPRRMAISMDNIQLIRRICIECRPRGMVTDAASEFQLWRYYQQWQESCKIIAKNLTGLQSLDLFIDIPRTVSRGQHLPALNMESMWAEAFLPLAKCTSLSTVIVHLSINWTSGKWVSRDSLEAIADYFSLVLRGRDHETAADAIRRRYEAWSEKQNANVSAMDQQLRLQCWQRLEQWYQISLI